MLLCQISIRALAQLIDGPLAAPVLPLVRLGWPVEPDEWDEPGLVVRGAVDELDDVVRVEAHVMRVTVTVGEAPLYDGVGNGLKADHAHPDEQDPDVFQGRASTLIDGPIVPVAFGGLDLLVDYTPRAKGGQ